jgi:hypothetical protein
MALDVLSIPAMSAEPERLFSSAKISITDRRNRLGIESMEAIECFKSWFSKVSVQTGAIALVSVVDVVLFRSGRKAGSYLLASALRSERTKH